MGEGGRGDVDDEDVIMFVVLSVFYWGRGEGGVTRLFSVYLHKIRRFDNSFANLNILFRSSKIDLVLNLLFEFENH